jgi:hypothetical protein
MAAVLAGVCVTAACGAPAGGAGGAPAASGTPATSGATPGTAGPAPVPPGVTLSHVQTADGSIVTVAAFHGPV